MLTVRIQKKNHSESIMVLKLKDGRHPEPDGERAAPDAALCQWGCLHYYHAQRRPEGDAGTDGNSGTDP